MGETVNIAAVAENLSADIFKVFRWKTHHRTNVNFSCLNEEHLNRGGKKIKSHSTDVVFSYDDPYMARRINLLTDLKSYAGKSITQTKVREALKSLALSVECASESQEWRDRFSLISTENNEVRGLLFVHNHDFKYQKLFGELLSSIHTNTLPIAATSVLHYLGPNDIQRLYTIANDIMRMQHAKALPTNYTFYYPDLVLRRRSGDIWDQAATVESLAGPFLIIKFRKTDDQRAGYLIYYNRPGVLAEEFEYLLDCFSRFQMLDSDESIHLRVVHQSADEDLKSHFDTAITKYARAWGFDGSREAILRAIEINRVPAVIANYNPGDMGWR